MEGAGEGTGGWGAPPSEPLVSHVTFISGRLSPIWCKKKKKGSEVLNSPVSGSQNKGYLSNIYYESGLK